MPIPAHSLQRSLTAITLGVARSMQERQQRDREMGLGEVELQYQVAISGTATATPGFATVEITFDYPLHYAPGQRDSDLSKPHFLFGAEADQPIGVMACVTEWATDTNNGAYIGATVAVGVIASSSVAYKGVAHLSFQGLGALSEGESGEGLG